MNSVFLISYALLWCIVGLLLYLVLHLQKRIQNLRTQPTAAAKQNAPILFEENHGIPKGHPFPALTFTTYDDQPFELSPKKQPQGSLIAFTSVDCSSCNALYEQLKSFRSKQPQYHIQIMMNGELEQIQQKVRNFHLDFPVIPYKPEDKEVYQTRITPFVYYINSEGRVVAKSVINYEDQLELLVSRRLNEAA
ncbi:hypothetical protein [Marinicrinis lubricantis]|uniref:Thioredoxin domain-containing protein n=1 Tax=Marinicrinis lubricantis TaxID=2086470 RepID=A0ABW1IQT0_9BACL